MAQSTTGPGNPAHQRLPRLPADHPLFKRGYMIGMRRSPAPRPKEEVPSPMPESEEN